VCPGANVRKETAFERVRKALRGEKALKGKPQERSRMKKAWKVPEEVSRQEG